MTFPQHLVKTCPFCSLMKPRPDRSRVSGLSAEELGDLIFLDHGSTKIGDQTFGCLIVVDGATSHLTTAYPCKSTSPSEVISTLHEWMDTFQIHPKAICAEGILSNAQYQEIPYWTTHTLWPNRAAMGVRLFKKFLSALVDTATKNLDTTLLSQIHTCPDDAQSSDGEKHTGNSE